MPENNYHQQGEDGNQPDGNQPQEPQSNQNDQSLQDYREGFAPETKKALEKFDSVEKLANGYIELEKDASRLRNRKTLPDENASEDEIKEFHKAIGVPESSEGYELSQPEMPEGMEFDSEMVQKLSEIAHSSSIPKQAFQDMFEAYNQYQIDKFNQQVQEVEKIKNNTIAELKKEWGDEYETNLASADSVIGRVFGEEFKDILVKTGLNNHPDTIKGMYKLYQTVGEHDFVNKGSTNRGSQEYNKSELRKRMNDPRYWDPSRRDNDFVKETEQYAEGLAGQISGE